MKRILSNRPVSVDFGILLLRLGVGFSMLIFHGWAKITGGPDTWTQVGGRMSSLGIGFAPTFWGFLASFAESAGSALLILGLTFRPAALMLGFTMFVAVLVHLGMPAENPNSGWKGASHALELLAVYVGLFFTGAGRFSVTWTRGHSA